MQGADDDLQDAESEYAKSFPYLTSRVSAELRTNIAEVRLHQLLRFTHAKVIVRFEIDSIRGYVYRRIMYRGSLCPCMFVKSVELIK